jgi:hypothetical protein
VNSGGSSPLSSTASIRPLITLTANTTETFSSAIATINNDTLDRAYEIIITATFATGNVTFSTNAKKTITIKGDTDTRQLINNKDYNLFTIPSGVSLTLGNNIILSGNDKSYSVIEILSGGTLKMDTGSTITSAKASGVKMNGGTFTMTGGSISGNTASAPTLTPSYPYGGGVYVCSTGIFTKAGGTIDATNSAGQGKVAYVYTGPKVRNTTAGTDVKLDSSISGNAGGWN